MMLGVLYEVLQLTIKYSVDVLEGIFEGLMGKDAEWLAVK
jgi:hypothetical protein